MSENEKQSEQQQHPAQQQTLPKRVALRDEPYYANCAMVQMTPFDLAILFGKITPVTNGAGQTQLVEMYDRQVYLSHLQAAALFDGLGRTISALRQAARQSQTGELNRGSGVQASEKES